MNKIDAIQIFEQKKVRTIWDEGQEKWYMSIIDVVSVLTESKDANAYWRKLKQRLKEEGNETVMNCHGLKMLAPDGKMRLTDVADTEQLFRLIQSIPSPKAEPFKVWLAKVASERLEEMQDPELSIDRALEQYLQLGYSENWINQRLKSIEIRKEWSDKSTKEYKIFKGLKKENLRDNMTNTELILNMLAEASTKDISQAIKPKIFSESKKVAHQGGNVAKVALKELEAKTGKKVVSNLKAKNFLDSTNNKKIK